jgi:hypothetical protein
MCWPSSEIVAGLVGGLLAIGGQIFVVWWQQRPQKKLDDDRKKTLKRLLDSTQHEWRKMETLQRVIGADRETTARLLVELGARGSTAQDDVWALIAKKPLPISTDD